MTSKSLAKVPEQSKAAVPVVKQSYVPVKIGQRQARHLAQAIQLEEGGTSALVRISVLLTCGMCAAFVVWAAFTRVPEIAVAEGTIVPSGQVITVQHLEGGVVEEVLVTEGELVEEGQSLIKMSPASAVSDLDQTRARETALQLKAERLKAFVESREPDFSFAPTGFEKLVSDNQAIFLSQNRAMESTRAVTEAQVKQKRSELDLLQQQRSSLQEQVDVISQEVKLRESLYNQHLITMVQYLDTKRELSRMQGELARNFGQTITAKESLSETENRLADQEATLRKQNMDDLSSVIGELAQVQESLGRVQDRVHRLAVTAPVRGYVKGLTQHYGGTVIQPGGIVCEIVPADKELTVEGKIDTRDIGHVQVGQRVKVKVQTYDPARFGVAWGSIRLVSANSFLDEKGRPYFKGLIGLDHDYVGDVPERYRVLPGMTVTAEVITGEKTLLQYMLKPIFTQLHESFHER